MTHGYAYRCDHCSKTDINESGVIVQARPPFGWIVVAVASESTRLLERVFCSLTCLNASSALLADDGAWS